MAPETRPAGVTSATRVAVSNITQQETYMQGPSGQPVQGYQISFDTPSKTRGSVFVPMSRYSVDNVDAEIQTKARAIEDVHKLAT